MRVSKPKSVMRSWVQKGERPIGLHVASADPAITDMAGSCGYDYVILEYEHGPLELSEIAHHVRAAEAYGMISLVRVGENNPNVIGKFLDMGCQGVILPHVQTADDARSLVAATRFGPVGLRGMCPSSHAADYKSGDTSEFTQNAERETIVGVIIESAAAVENIAEIVAVDGIDLILFGPGDLSHELGVVAEGWQSPLIQDAWERVLTATRAANKLIMGFVLQGSTNDGTVEAARKQFAEGSDLVTLNMDLLLFRNLLKDLADAKKLAPAHSTAEGLQESLASL